MLNPTRTLDFSKGRANGHVSADEVVLLTNLHPEKFGAFDFMGRPASNEGRFTCQVILDGFVHDAHTFRIDVCSKNTVLTSMGYTGDNTKATFEHPDLEADDQVFTIYKERTRPGRPFTVKFTTLDPASGLDKLVTINFEPRPLEKALAMTYTVKPVK